MCNNIFGIDDKEWALMSCQERRQYKRNYRYVHDENYRKKVRQIARKNDKAKRIKCSKCNGLMCNVSITCMKCWQKEKRARCRYEY